MPEYTLGIDFGTLSGRTVLMNCANGMIVASAAMDYPHGVIDRCLPDGRTLLPDDWALEYPADYLLVLEKTVREVMERSKVSGEDVVGLSLDFTSCTVVAADETKRPLCELEGFESRPHAYAKLWKHHGAQREADLINGLLSEKGMIHEPRFGGAVSPELLLPKILEVAQEDPQIYEKAFVFMEAGDWLTWILTDELKRSGNMAAYKAMWTEEEGYLSRELLEEMHPLFRNLVTEKLKGEICPAGGRIGSLTKEWAARLGLRSGIAVGASIIDSHAGLPGSGVYRPGQMMLVLGTSSVELLLTDHPYAEHGVVGGVRGAIMPGYYALEAGLAAVGDMYGWFVDGYIPLSYQAKAKENGMNLHQYLSSLAKDLYPGASGLLALDWWNGNKSPYVNGSLSGVLVGLTLHTRPEEIYRALIEATAYGTRLIMEEFMKSGAEVDEVIVSGGIAEKNPLVLEIFADVLRRPLKISSSEQTAAFGSAMYAAAAAGSEAGGYASITEASAALAKLKDIQYQPDEERAQIYDQLYAAYCELVKAFDPEKNPVMRILNGLKRGKQQNART